MGPVRIAPGTGFACRPDPSWGDLGANPPHGGGRKTWGLGCGSHPRYDVELNIERAIRIGPIVTKPSGARIRVTPRACGSARLGFQLDVHLRKSIGTVFPAMISDRRSSHTCPLATKSISYWFLPSSGGLPPTKPASFWETPGPYTPCSGLLAPGPYAEINIKYPPEASYVQSGHGPSDPNGPFEVTL